MKKELSVEISSEAFYAEANMRFLREGIAQLNAGKGVEHEIIEVEE